MRVHDTIARDRALDGSDRRSIAVDGIFPEKLAPSPSRARRAQG